MNDYNYEYGAFVIWPNAELMKAEILNIVNKKFEIIRIISIKNNQLPKLINYCYQFNIYEIIHIINKTKYLKNFPGKFDSNIIIVADKNPKHKLINSTIRKDYILNINFFELKWHIRRKFNNRNINKKLTQDHIIHSTDNELQVKILLKQFDPQLYWNLSLISKSKNIFESKSKISRGCLPEIKTQNSHKINFKLLKSFKANIICGERWKEKTSTFFINETPHYALLNGSINTYQNYIKKYQGTKLKCFYSVNKYIQLIEKITVKEIEQYPILVKKRNKDYLIIDGLHRACIALFYKQDINIIFVI